MFFILSFRGCDEAKNAKSVSLPALDGTAVVRKALVRKVEE